jgi:peroxiredoxin
MMRLIYNLSENRAEAGVDFHMKLWYFTICSLIIFLIIGCETKPQTEKAGKVADFNLMDSDSVTRSLADFEGEVIMLHFWADWCPHCRREFPELQKAYEDLKSKGFVLVAINSGQTFDHVTGIQQEFNLTFPMLLDENTEVAQAYQVAGLPSSFFIDTAGNILDRETGWMTEEKIKEIFNRLVARDSV